MSAIARLLSLVLLLLTLTGCAPALGEGTATPLQNRIPTPSPVSVAPSVPDVAPTVSEASEGGPDLTGSGDGMTREQELATFPPEPQNFTVTVTEEGVLLKWKAPPPVTTFHQYSDEILGYYIYRRIGDADYTRIGSTQAFEYLDRTAEKGVRYYYTVSALHEQNIESNRPTGLPATR